MILHIVVKKVAMDLGSSASEVGFKPQFGLSGLFFIMIESKENVIKDVILGLSHCYICPHVSGNLFPLSLSVHFPWWSAL